MNPWIALRRLVFFAFAANFIVIAWPDTSAAQALATDDVVLWTAAASPGDVHGDWVREADGTAAGGVRLRNPDRGRLKMTAALASPVNYFEMSFTARRATPYHLWIRMQARNDSTRNDSVHVQFSDSVDAIGQSLIRIGTTSSAEMVLQNGPSGSPLGWGWTDNGWGVLGEPIYFEADGTHVIRIQQREDGTVIDQIVLSPVTFATAAPGAPLADTKILPRALGIGPSVSAATSVIRVASAAAGRMFGTWQTIADATAAGSQALRNPDAGTATIAPALSNPASYFEATFNADAGRPYHVWVRMKTDGNSLSNDSVHLQFSDSMTSGSSPTAQIGTTSSLEAVLQNGPNGPAPHGWGWTDNGWGALGSHVYFVESGTHTLRVQQREDGAVIDQIVISPDTFLTTPVGWRLDDVTILQASAPPPPANLPPTVSLTAPANGASYTAPATITLAATASDPENRLSKVDFYNGSTLLASDASAPFGWTWSAVAAGSYQLRAVAVDADGASATATVTVGVTAPPSNQPPSVTLTAPANNATFTAPATIAISANASDPENRLARVEFYNGSALLGTDTSSPFSFTWSSVGAGSYQLKAVAVDADGGSASSATAAVTVTTATPPPFPPGWQHQDVGAPAVAGSASFTNGTFTVTGAGTNIWNASDEFHFVYQQVTGDVDIIARVASLQGSNEWSKAGVMVRESLADNARHGLAHFTLGNGARYTWRTVTGGTTGDSGGCAPGTTGWVRLTRTGSSLQRRYSADGQTWSSCATVTISMAPAVYVGLVVSNVDATQRATAVFDNVSVTTPGGTTNQPPTVSLTTNGSTFTAPATITLSATASDPENRLSKVDFYNGSTLLATDTSAPYSFTWSSVTAGSYSLRAVATDADGGSASSATATVTVGTSTPSPTRQVVFTASVDHAIVTSYLLEVFPSTANPATATAMASSDLGKPTPSGTNEISVDRSTFLNNLAPGSYLVTVASVGSGGKSRGAAISFTR